VLHLVGILFPHINDDALSKSHQKLLYVIVLLSTCFHIPQFSVLWPILKYSHVRILPVDTELSGALIDVACNCPYLRYRCEQRTEFNLFRNIFSASCTIILNKTGNELKLVQPLLQWKSNKYSYFIL